MAEPATETMSYFLLARAGRSGQPLGGGAARAGHLLFSTVTFLLYLLCNKKEPYHIYLLLSAIFSPLTFLPFTYFL
jgi:hypothetical protein